jgi:hypothetical protein
MVDTVTLIDLASATNLGAGAARETELTQQLRNDAGMVALLGPNGAAVFAELDATQDDFAQELIAEVAAAIDSGELPGAEGAATLPRALAATGPFAIDVSLFANTGFTTSALMSMFAQVVQQAGTDGSGTLPRQESFDQTSNGLRQQVDLGTTITVQTGGGRVTMEIIMTATDRISNAADGTFVALYTSRSTGHFDVNACPDDGGVGEGTYTFETTHELNDVSGASAARSGGGRSVEAPFRLINGEDARLVQIEATLDMEADARGPGTATGPGPTEAFDWGATQTVNVVMPANGSTTATGEAISVTGSGGVGAGGAMAITSAIAQLFLAEVGREAQRFWRSGECIELKTTEESRDVNPDESVDFEATAVGKFDGADIDAPIKGSFSGKQSLDPDGQAQDPPAQFTFTAGSEQDDKGTIQLEQVGVRGMGKKTLEFTVKPADFRVVNAQTAVGGLTGIKCDGIGGDWVLDYAGQLPGTTTFTLPDDGSTGAAHTDMFADFGGATAHYVLDGTASVERYPDGSYWLNFELGSGTLTAEAEGQSTTTQISFPATLYELEQGDFCP